MSGLNSRRTSNKSQCILARPRELCNTSQWHHRIRIEVNGCSEEVDILFRDVFKKPNFRQRSTFKIRRMHRAINPPQLLRIFCSRSRNIFALYPSLSLSFSLAALENNGLQLIQPLIKIDFVGPDATANWTKLKLFRTVWIWNKKNRIKLLSGRVWFREWFN